MDKINPQDWQQQHWHPVIKQHLCLHLFLENNMMFSLFPYFLVIHMYNACSTIITGIFGKFVEKEFIWFPIFYLEDTFNQLYSE